MTPTSRMRICQSRFCALTPAGQSRRSAWRAPLPAAAATGGLRERIRRFRLRLGRRDGDPAAAPHALIVERAALRALAVVAAELFRRVLLIHLHPLALVESAA